MKNLKRLILICLITVCHTTCRAAANPVAERDSLLAVLDEAVASRSAFAKEKQRHIAILWDQYHDSDSPRERYRTLTSLFNQYKSYAMDTTLTIAREAVELARSINSDSLFFRAKLMEAEAEKGYGNYYRSLQILDSMPQLPWLRVDLLNRYCSVYYSLEEMAPNSLDHDRWNAALIAYRDSLSRESADSNGRMLNIIELRKQLGHPDEAIALYNKYADSIAAAGAEPYAAFDFSIGEAYLQVGDTLNAELFLLRTAIADLRASVKKYTALPTIAKILYAKGDNERAYNYIMASLADVRASQAQSRLQRVLENLPIISQAYAERRKSEKRVFIILVAAISVLALMLLAALVDVYQKNKKLHAEDENIRRSNEELTRLKTDLNQLNERLRRENHTKEEYIGRLFSLCSEYIKIINSSHNHLIKSLKSGANIREIEKQILAMQTGAELSSFFSKFDQSVLAIFPDFIRQYNDLMRPEFQTIPPNGTLTPELRIIALIRLGFTDTAQIAAFLHYSPQTVYNYRCKARAHARMGREDFINALKKI